VTDRRILRNTLAVSFVLHLLLAVLTWNVPFLPSVPPEAAAEPTVELFLVPDDLSTPAAAEDPEQPTRYTEIPDRLADERPDQADFLAMRDSRAADRLPGGQDGDQPGTEREAEFPQVAVAPENLAGAEGVTVEQPVLSPQAQPREEAERAQAEQQEEQRGAEVEGPGDVLIPEANEAEGEQQKEGEEAPNPERGDFDDWLAEQRTPSLLKEGEQQAPGDRGFDYRQQEQSRIGANVALDGDFSLSTYEWNFAPWMRRFANDLHRSWMAPYAYRLGIISGYTRIRLVVERDGRPSRMEVLEEEGHESLHTASMAALQAFAPYAPLPPDFPDDQLVILLGLHYPAWKRR
jgi:outer membrane biosynthesis protein TonB